MVDKSQKLLVGAGVDSTKLEKLKSLKFLLDNIRVHRCHQYSVKDNMWDLAT